MGLRGSLEFHPDDLMPSLLEQRILSRFAKSSLDCNDMVLDPFLRNFEFFLIASYYLSISPQGGIQVTENGCACEPTGATAEAAVDDKARIAYFQGYLEEMHHAIQIGADVRAVSLLHTMILLCFMIYLLLVQTLNSRCLLVVSHLTCIPVKPFKLLQSLDPSLVILFRVLRSAAAHQFYAWSFMDNFGEDALFL